MFGSPFPIQIEFVLDLPMSFLLLFFLLSFFCFFPSYYLAFLTKQAKYIENFFHHIFTTVFLTERVCGKIIVSFLIICLA